MEGQKLGRAVGRGFRRFFGDSPDQPTTEKRHPWRSAIIFLIGCALIMWFSGGVRPAY
jgi:hypothetical protein